MSRFRWILPLALLVAWVPPSHSAARLATVTPAPVTPGPSASLRQLPAQPEGGERPVCEDLRCGTSLNQETCEACSLFRQGLSPAHLEQVSLSGSLIERGVALRAVSVQPDVQDRLFAVAAARNDILQQLHEGGDVDLCQPCITNARSFQDVQFGVERIPEGVILSYTSNRDDLVEWLQVMLMNAHELPL